MKSLYVVAVHSVRVDESSNGDYTKQGHNRVFFPTTTQFVTEWKENPDWQIGQVVEISSYNSQGQGWYGGHTYRKVGVVIHHYQLPEVVTFPQGMPEPTPFEDLDEEAKKEHNEALDWMVSRGHSIEKYTYFVTKASVEAAWHNPKCGHCDGDHFTEECGFNLANY